MRCPFSPSKLFGFLALAVVSLNLEAWSEPTLRVGLILPLSGEFVVLGQACKKGVDLAADEIKAEGAALEILTEDSPSALAVSTLNAYRKLQSVDGVQVFLGFVSPEELQAVAPLAVHDQSALVAIGSPRERIEAALIIWMNQQTEADQLAALVRKKHKAVAILSANQDWEGQVSDAFSTSFTKRGGKVVLRLEHPYGDKDVSTEVARLQHSPATAVVIPPYSLFSVYVRALQKQRQGRQIYSLELDQAAIDESLGAAEGALIIRPKNAGGDFARRFAAAYAGRAPDIPAGQCYDGLKIIAQLFKAGSKSGQDFRAAFSNLREYHGSSGEIRFTPEGTVMETETLRVKNGRLVPIVDEIQRLPRP